MKRVLLLFLFLLLAASAQGGVIPYIIGDTAKGWVDDALPLNGYQTTGEVFSVSHECVADSIGAWLTSSSGKGTYYCIYADTGEAGGWFRLVAKTDTIVVLGSDTSWYVIAFNDSVVLHPDTLYLLGVRARSSATRVMAYKTTSDSISGYAYATSNHVAWPTVPDSIYVITTLPSTSAMMAMALYVHTTEPRRGTWVRGRVK